MPIDHAELAELIERAIERAVAVAVGQVGTNRARFLGIGEAAAHVGLSDESIRRLIAAGKLTPLRPVRGKVLLDRLELENYVLNSTSIPRTGRGMAKAAG